MKIQIRLGVRSRFSLYLQKYVSISLTLWRNRCPSHQQKKARSPYPTLCDNLGRKRRNRKRRGYGTSLHKAKHCKQTDDCTNSVNYEANEKLKGSSNEKFDQMLFRLSFQVIK